MSLPTNSEYLARGVYSAEGCMEQIWEMPPLPIKSWQPWGEAGCAPWWALPCEATHWSRVPQFDRKRWRALIPRSRSDLPMEGRVFSYPRLGRKLHYLCLVILFTGILRQMIALLACLWQLPRYCFLLAAQISQCLQQFVPKELSGPCVPHLLSATQPERQESKCPLSLTNALGTFLRPFGANGALSTVTGRKGDNRHWDRGRRSSKACRGWKVQRPRLTNHCKTKGVV